MTDTFKTSDVVVDPTQQPQDKDLNALLIKRVDDSQRHIEKIHGKLDLQNEVIEKQNKLIEQLLAGAQNLNVPQQEGSGTTSPAIDPSKLLQDVQEAVKTTLKQEKDAEQARASEGTKKQNFASVSTELTQRYGDKVDEMVQKIAASNDMSFQEAIALAEARPKLFLSLFPKEQQAPAGTRSSVNTSSLHADKKTAPSADPRRLNSLMDRYAELEQQLTNRG